MESNSAELAVGTLNVKTRMGEVRELGMKQKRRVV